MSSLYAKLIAVIEQKITPMAGAIGGKDSMSRSEERRVGKEC